MPVALVWFRRDLRLADNPALQAAIDDGHTPLPVYIREESLHHWPPGAASRWWLHHSVAALQVALRELDSDLLIFTGQCEDVLPWLARQTGARAVYWNRCYEAERIECDMRVKAHLTELGLEVASFGAALLHEPWNLLKKDETPYRVFTPFWKALQEKGVALPGDPAPDALPPVETDLGALDPDRLGLLPQRNWDKQFYEHWQPGEAGAWQALERFCEDALADYPDQRDLPAIPGTSRLSPHLHFGEISPRQVWHYVHNHAAGTHRKGAVRAAEAFTRQLAWRDFGHHLLYHFPHTADQPLDARFDAFPWRSDYADDLRRWQQGRTGIPIVDAGMRELWETGWMHNRLRMICASLLTKNLLIPWQEGARWFWDTLVDADLANNTLGWQWTAGCGADAAPYFRIFNPLLQGERFDADGEYLRRWLPELGKLPRKWIARPWEAPPAVLAEAGIELGDTYPAPIVDLKASRQRALDAWARIRQH
jgi:deoxyribodipyrimidine photo-lyase